MDHGWLTSIMAIDPVKREDMEQLLRRACREVELRVRAGEDLVAEAILDVHPELATDMEKALDVIYTEYVTREELGQHPAGAELLARFPQWSSRLERLLDVDAALVDVKPESRTVFPKSTWNSDPKSVTTHSPDPPSPIRKRIGQYEILQEIGRGGMGIVYRARQVGLNRIVALKVIQAEQVSPGQQSRFRTEAMAIAQMQHPNIVRIIEIGEQDDTRFISLEYAAEGSLDRKLVSGPYAIRTAAEAVETLARAVEYAHQMGIIHRDLKPANVLIAAGGTLKVADFGLAKWYLGPSTDQTQSGALLGTPCYMSPEQAGGRPDQIGPATDIYALGTLLYELLTGQPPFISESALDTLEQIRTKEPPSPRRSRKSIPRDLETICLRCLQKDPRRRFRTAGDLADDLHRFLEHEPIQSRSIRLHEKGWRWVRRHAVAAVLTTAMVIMCLVGSIFLILNRWEIDDLSTDVALSSKRAKVIEKLAVQAQSEAEATLNEASKFADRLSRQGQDMLRVPGLTEIGQKSLDQALAYQEQLLKQKPDDPKLQQNAAQAYVMVGCVLRDRGKYELAEKRIVHGIAVWAELSQRFPNDTNYQYGHAQAIAHLAFLQTMVFRMDDSIATYRQSIRLFEKLVQRKPDKRYYKYRQAVTYLNFAVPFRARGKLQQAERELRTAIEVAWNGIEQAISAKSKQPMEPWIAQRKRFIAARQKEGSPESRILPDVQLLRQLPPTVLSNLVREGWVTCLSYGYEDIALGWERLGHYQDAERGFHQAFEIRRLAAMYDGPKAENLELLARSHWNLARCEYRHGLPLEAEDHLRQAIDLLLGLEKDSPQWTNYPNCISANQILLGKSLRLRGHYRESEDMLRQAVNRCERLHRESQETFNMRFQRSEGHRELGLVFYEQGRLNESVLEMQQAYRAQPLNMLAVYDLAWCLSLVPDLPFRRTHGVFAISTKSLVVAASLRDKLLAEGTLKKTPQLDRSLRRSNRGNNYDRLLQAFIAWELHRPVRSLQLIGRVVRSIRSPGTTAAPPSGKAIKTPVTASDTNRAIP